MVEWGRGPPEDWATESLEAARIAYRLPSGQLVRPGTRLGDDYCEMALPIIQQQLGQAGVRLAWVLNGVFR